jgi:FixJ family two-component response regulator
VTEALPLVLIVDDDVAVGRLLQEVLTAQFNALAVSSPRKALDLVKERDVAVVVADQRMPEMSGLELLSEVRRLAPTAVGVLITAHADLQAAMQAINSAQVLGFITKPWDEDELLVVMQRAVDAHLTLDQLRRATARRERELTLFEQLADSAPAPITAQRFGVLPLRDSLPREFDRLADTYSRILGMALEQRAFKVDRHVGQELNDLADRLGQLSAGPRDVVDLHVAALRDRLARATPEEASALSDEGRFLVLELMGDVVTYYRSYRLGVRA